MTIRTTTPDISAITSNERATPSLVYRALLRSIREGQLVPGGKIPNERDLASQLKTSRTAVRAALAMMERQGLVDRKIGSGTFLTDNADSVFESMDQTSADSHEGVPSFVEIAEGRLLFEPAMMDLVCARVEDSDIEQMRTILDRILNAPTWHEFKEQIYALHRQIYEATKNRFLVQIMESILADRRAVSFDGRDSDQPTPPPVRRQTHEDLAAIVKAIADRDAKRAEELTSDHLLRTLATINIWN
jgi:GntR family transcriptional regulator, transcriptional repressor for pyruvate dehydrogenase complex